ncbi:MAG: hypothetical protein ACT4PZ_13540 [Panacagrimonas sp.]
METQYELTNLWEAPSEALRQDVIRFWVAERALPLEVDIAARAAQVLLLARDQTGAIAGVCTAYNAVHPRIEHLMFHFRAFIAPQARRQNLARTLTLAAQKYLETHNQRLPPQEKALGLIMEVEATVLKTSPVTRQACWPSTQMQFIGRTPGGAHLRVWYFEDAPLNFA